MRGSLTLVKKLYYYYQHQRPATTMALNLNIVEMRLNACFQLERNAAGWDNVGLIIGSLIEKNDKVVEKVMVCIDLTPAVVEEAIQIQADLIVAYHPPIFRPLKSMAYNSWKERVVSQCIGNNIPVYSPHTALDAIPGGINDHLVKVLANLSSVVELSPIKAATISRLPRVNFDGPPSLIFNAFNSLAYVDKNEIGLCLDGTTVVERRLEGNVELSVASECVENLQKAINSTHLVWSTPEAARVVVKDVASCQSSDSQSKGILQQFWPGIGRLVTLSSAVPLSRVTKALKEALNIISIQVAERNRSEKMVQRFAICVGSGGSTFTDCPDSVDCFITGEISHHEVLDIIHEPREKVVIICGHSESERHYLPTLQKLLTFILKGEDTTPNVVISAADVAPSYTISNFVKK